MRIVLALAVVVAFTAGGLAPLADAHGGEGPTFQQRIAKDVVFKFAFLQQVVQADSPLTAALELNSLANGRPVPDETVTATLTRIDAASSEPAPAFTLGPGPTIGAYEAQVTIPERGVWNVTFHAATLDASVTFSLDVFPRSPWLVEAPDADIGVYYARDAVRIPVLFHEEATGEPAPAPSDGVMRVEKWTDDHSKKLGERTVPLRASGAPGEVILDTPFEEPGMYHLWVGAPSLGLSPGDRPMIHLYVLDSALRIDATPPTRDSPTAGALAALGALAAVALLAAARRP